MAYEPTIWKDRVVEKPRTFNIVNNPDGTVTLVPAPGVVVEEGTPVNAANLNKLEQGLKTHEADYASEELGHVFLKDVENTWRKIDAIVTTETISALDITIPSKYNYVKIMCSNLKRSIDAMGMIILNVNSNLNNIYSSYTVHAQIDTGYNHNNLDVGSNAIPKFSYAGKGECVIDITNQGNSPKIVKSEYLDYFSGPQRRLVLGTVNLLEKINVINLTSPDLASGATFEVWGR